MAKDAFLERVGLLVEKADAGFERSAFSVISSAVHEVREVFDLMATDTDEDWQTIGDRLAAVPAAVAGYRETLDAEAAAGRVSARRQYVEVASQIRGWTGQEGASGDYFGNLVAAAPDGLRDRLAAVAAAASASYADFGRYAESDLAPQGREVDGVGREHYALESRYFLGAEVDLEETYRWGWEELERIEDDMARTAQRIVAGGSIDDAVKALDPTRPATAAAARRSRPGCRSRPIQPRRLRRHALRHRRADPHHRLQGGADQRRRAWYTPPSEDFSRPGTMWFSFTDEHEIYSTWRETTTVFHEGVPGHHLQVAQVVLPRRPAQPLAAAAVLGLRPRRGLGALLRATDGRARLLRRRRRPARHARRPGLAGRSRDRRHRHAPRS